MIAINYRRSTALALIAFFAVAASQATAADLKRAVPADAYLFAYGKHNPERDFQREHWADVCRTVQETQIVEKALKIITSRIPESDMEKASAIMEELREAASPIDIHAMVDCKEVVYAQSMPAPVGDSPQSPQSQHLVLFRMTPEVAAAYQEGIINLFQVAEKYAGGAVTVETSEVEGVTLTTLVTPGQVPLRPAVAVIDDVLLITTSEVLAGQSLALLSGSGGPSKFDDPRLQEALADLPEAEDALVFHDVKQQFAQLKGIGDYVRQVGGDAPETERVAGLMELLFGEFDVLDYEATVQYTDGNINRSIARGVLQAGAEEKTFGQIALGGESFEDWQSWVPADAVSYSLTSGVDLHAVYDWAMEIIEEHVPEAAPVLEQFEMLQTAYDINLDEDILQSFSGECVSVAMPGPAGVFGGGTQSVLALRCQNPERIGELLERLITVLTEIPAVKAQQLKFIPCEELEGFQQMSMTMLPMLGVQPVVGFRDGWMFVATSPAAVQRVLDVRSGEADSIAGTEAFQQFGIDVTGPVMSIKYSNVAANLQQAAKTLNQIGMMAPMIIGMAAGQGQDEGVKVLQEVLALLPDLGKIVAKFDFYQASLKVTQPGDASGSYVRQSALLVRPAAAE